MNPNSKLSTSAEASIDAGSKDTTSLEARSREAVAAAFMDPQIRKAIVMDAKQGAKSSDKLPVFSH